MAALELARSGAPIAAVVSFHGFFNTPNPADAHDIQAPIQAHHGTLDPLVPAPEVDAFRREMDDAGVDWHLVMHGEALHGFMNPAAVFPEKGVAYHPVAAVRAWTMMREFLEEQIQAST
jgi:dienelactone hydrolase